MGGRARTFPKSTVAGAKQKAPAADVGVGEAPEGGGGRRLKGQRAAVGRSGLSAPPVHKAHLKIPTEHPRSCPFALTSNNVIILSLCTMN